MQRTAELLGAVLHAQKGRVGDYHPCGGGAEFESGPLVEASSLQLYVLSPQHDPGCSQIGRRTRGTR